MLASRPPNTYQPSLVEGTDLLRPVPPGTLNSVLKQAGLKK